MKWKYITIILLSLGLYSSVSSSVINPKDKIDSLYQRMLHLVAGEFKPDPADTTLEGLKWLEDFLDRSSSNWGALQSIDSPLFHTENEASIVFRLQEIAYELIVEIDSLGNWGSILLTNYVPKNELSTLGLTDLGEDTLRVNNLTDISVFTEAFNKDSGAVRIVSILSPT